MSRFRSISMDRSQCVDRAANAGTRESRSAVDLSGSEISYDATSISECSLDQIQQPIFEDFALDDSFEELTFKTQSPVRKVPACPNLPTAETRSELTQTTESFPQNDSSICIPPPPKNKQDRKAYIERARAIHQRQQVSKQKVSAVCPGVKRAPSLTISKGRQPLSRWPGGKPPRVVSKAQSCGIQSTRTKSSQASQTQLGQSICEKSSRTEVGPEQSVQGRHHETAHGKSKSDVATRSRSPCAPATRDQSTSTTVRRSQSPGVPVTSSQSTKCDQPICAPVSCGESLPNQLFEKESTHKQATRQPPIKVLAKRAPLKEMGSQTSDFAAIARARRLAGFRSTRPELNPAVAARIAADKAEAERIATLPGYQRIQERMKRLRRTPSTLRTKKILSPTKLGTLQAIKSTASLTQEPAMVCGYPKRDAMPRSRRSRRKLKQVESWLNISAESSAIRPLSKSREWHPAVRKAKHTDSELWYKRFPRVFSGTRRKGSRRLEVMAPLLEEEESDISMQESPENLATRKCELDDTVGSVLSEESDIESTAQETISGYPKRTDAATKWERLQDQSQRLYGSTTSVETPQTEEEALDEFMELEQMCEHMHGETPNRAPSSSTHQMDAASQTPQQMAGVPGYVKLADFKYRQEVCQRNLETARAQAISEVTDDISMDDEVNRKLQNIAQGVDWTLEGIESQTQSVLPSNMLAGNRKHSAHASPKKCPSVHATHSMELAEVIDISDEQLELIDDRFSPTAIEPVSIDLDISGISETDIDLENVSLDGSYGENEANLKSVSSSPQGVLASVVESVVDTVKNMFSTTSNELKKVEEDECKCINLDTSLPNMFVQEDAPGGSVSSASEEEATDVHSRPQKVCTPPLQASERVPPSPKDKRDRKAYIERAKAIHKLQQKRMEKNLPASDIPTTKVKSCIPTAETAPRRKEKAPKKKKKDYPPGEHSPSHCAAVAKARREAGLKNTRRQLNPELEARIAEKKAQQEARRRAREEELAAEAALPGPERFRSKIQRLKREGHAPLCPQPSTDTLGQLEAIRTTSFEPTIEEASVQDGEGEGLTPAEKYKKYRLKQEQAAQQVPAQTSPRYEEDIEPSPVPYSPIRLQSPPCQQATRQERRERTIHQIGPHGGQEVINQTIITTKNDEFGNVTCHVQRNTGPVQENLQHLADIALTEFPEDIPALMDDSVPTPGEIIEALRHEVHEKIGSIMSGPTRTPASPCFPNDLETDDILNTTPIMEADDMEETMVQETGPGQGQEALLNTSLPQVFSPPSEQKPGPVSVSQSPQNVSRTISPAQPKQSSPITVPPSPKNAADRSAFIQRARAIQALKMREQRQSAATVSYPQPRKPVARGSQITSRRKMLGMRKQSPAPQMSCEDYQSIAIARRKAGLRNTRPETNPELAARVVAERAEAERFAALPQHEKIQERMSRLRAIPREKRKVAPLSPTLLGTLAGIKSSSPYPAQSESVQSCIVQARHQDKAPPRSPKRKREPIVLPNQLREKERERDSKRFKEILQPTWKPKERRYMVPKSDVYLKTFEPYRSSGRRGAKPLHVMSPISELDEMGCPSVHKDEDLDEFERMEKACAAQEHFGAAKAAQCPSLQTQQALPQQKCLPEVPTFQPKYSSIPDWVARHYQEEVQEFAQPREQMPVADNLLEPYIPTAPPRERLRMIKEAEERARTSAKATQTLDDAWPEEPLDIEYTPLVLESPTRSPKAQMPSQQQLIDIEGPQKLPPKRLQDLEGCPHDVDFIEYEGEPEPYDMTIDEDFAAYQQSSDTINRLRNQICKKPRQEAQHGDGRVQHTQTIRPLPEDLPTENICDLNESILVASPPKVPPAEIELESCLPTLFQEVPQVTSPCKSPCQIRQRYSSPTRISPTQPKQSSPITVPPSPKSAADRLAFIQRARAIQALKMREQRQSAATVSYPQPRKPVARGSQITSRRKMLGMRKQSPTPQMSCEDYQSIAIARRKAGLRNTRPETNPELAARVAAERAEAERFAALPQHEKIQERVARLRAVPAARRKRIYVSPNVLGTLMGIKSSAPKYPSLTALERVDRPAADSSKISSPIHQANTLDDSLTEFEKQETLCELLERQINQQNVATSQARVSPRARYKQIVEQRSRRRSPSPPASPEMQPDYHYSPLGLCPMTPERTQTPTTQLENLCAPEDDLDLRNVTPDNILERPRPADIIEKVRRETMERMQRVRQNEVPTDMLVDLGPTPPKMPRIVAQEDISKYACPVFPASPPSYTEEPPQGQRVCPNVPASPTDLNSSLPQIFEPLALASPPPATPASQYASQQQACPSSIQPRPRSPSPVAVPPEPKCPKDRRAFIERARAIHALKAREEVEVAPQKPRIRKRESSSRRERGPSISYSRRYPSRYDRVTSMRNRSARASGERETPTPISREFYEAVARARRMAGLQNTKPETNPEVAARRAAEQIETERLAALTDFERLQERMQKVKSKGLKKSQLQPNAESITAYLESLKSALPAREKFEMLRRRTPRQLTTEYPQISPRSRYKQITERPQSPRRPSSPTVEEFETDVAAVCPVRPETFQLEVDDFEDVCDLQTVAEPSFADIEQIDEVPGLSDCRIPMQEIQLPSDLPEENLLDYSLPMWETSPPRREQAILPCPSPNVSLPNAFEDTTPPRGTVSGPVIKELPMREGPASGLSRCPVAIPSPPQNPKDREAFIKRARAIQQLQKQQGKETGSFCLSKQSKKPSAKVSLTRRTGRPPMIKAKTTKSTQVPYKPLPIREALRRPSMLKRQVKQTASHPSTALQQSHIEAVMRARALAGLKRIVPDDQGSACPQLTQQRKSPTFESIKAQAACIRAQQQLPTRLSGRQIAAAQRTANLQQRQERIAHPHELPGELVFEAPQPAQERLRIIQKMQAKEAASAGAYEDACERTPPTPVPFYVPHCPIELADSPSQISAQQMPYKDFVLEEETAPEFYEDYETPEHAKKSVCEMTPLNNRDLTPRRFPRQRRRKTTARRRLDFGSCVTPDDDSMEEFTKLEAAYDATPATHAPPQECFNINERISSLESELYNNAIPHTQRPTYLQTQQPQPESIRNCLALSPPTPDYSGLEQFFASPPQFAHKQRQSQRAASLRVAPRARQIQFPHISGKARRQKSRDEAVQTQPSRKTATTQMPERTTSRCPLQSIRPSKSQALQGQRCPIPRSQIPQAQSAPQTQQCRQEEELTASQYPRAKISLRACKPSQSSRRVPWR